MGLEVAVEEPDGVGRLGEQDVVFGCLRRVGVEPAYPHVPHPQAEVGVDGLGDDAQRLRQLRFAVVDGGYVALVGLLHGLRAADRGLERVVEERAEARGVRGGCVEPEQGAGAGRLVSAFRGSSWSR